MTNSVSSRQQWLFNETSTEPMKKNELINHYIDLMYARTSRMFTYKNLPEYIRTRDIEYILQSKGYCVGVEVEGKPYLLWGTFAGRLNEYFIPTQCIITNPYLNLSKTYTIGKDCVVIRNDSSYEGLMYIARKYATLLAETDISLKYGAINSRILQLISASDDITKQSAQKVFKKIVDGEDFEIIASKPLLDSLKTYPYASGNDSYIKSLLELHQYLKANWYIDLGINANYNMKRESLSANEVDVNENTLIPLVEDMLDCRKEDLEKFNKMFNTNIEVELNSSWKKIFDEIKLEVESKENEVEVLKSEVDMNQESQEIKESETKDNEV